MTWRQLSDPSSKTIKYNTKRWSTSFANEDQTRTFQVCLNRVSGSRLSRRKKSYAHQRAPVDRLHSLAPPAVNIQIKRLSNFRAAAIASRMDESCRTWLRSSCIDAFRPSLPNSGGICLPQTAWRSRLSSGGWILRPETLRRMHTSELNLKATGCILGRHP